MTDRGRSIEGWLERFIFDELLEAPLTDADPLESGAVDSLGLEQLIEHIEREFSIVIDDDEMIRENFASVPALAAFVDSKLPLESR